MKKITNEELNKIHGGAINASLVATILSVAVLVIGIVDGFLRPKKCN